MEILFTKENNRVEIYTHAGETKEKISLSIEEIGMPVLSSAIIFVRYEHVDTLYYHKVINKDMPSDVAGYATVVLTEPFYDLVEKCEKIHLKLASKEGVKWRQ